MPKKITKIPSIFKNKEAKQPWQHWPSCMNSNTLSFRASHDETSFKLVDITPPEILLVNSIECASFSTDDHREENESSLEVVISEARMSSSERLFFEPNETSSIVKGAKGTNCNNHDDHGMFVFKDSVALEMESDDPYLDFKKSMQEMLESTFDDHQGNNLLLKDDKWDYLEELLGWYLRFNVKMNHGFIIGAFLDLLIELAHASSPEMKNKPLLSCLESTSYSSASSSFSSHST